LADLLANLIVPRILVVDEDENTRRRLTRLFNKENYSVLATGDGAEALVLALESQLDLIIVDLDLSAPMTALEVLERLRPIPHVAQVPIVVLSGPRSAAAFTAARQLGAVGSVPKPFQTHKLLHFVRSLLEQ
jgi:DNA-binding response OmpR family regulator